MMQSAAILTVGRHHALKESRLTFQPCPFQLMTNLVDAACDLFKLCPLNPRPTLQHVANASKFLGRGPEPMFSLSNIYTHPENFPHLPLVTVNTPVGPEHRDALAVAQHVFINAKGIAIRVLYHLCQKGRHISTLKPSKGRQCAQHWLA